MKEMLGLNIPYISTANWVIIAALFFFLTFISVWALFGKGVIRDFFLSSLTKPDGRADEKKLTMFTILTMYIFLHIRGAIVGVWMPEYVFWGLTGLIAVWLGFAYQFLKVKEQIESERNKAITKVDFSGTATTETPINE